MEHQNLMLEKYIHHCTFHWNPTQFSKNSNRLKDWYTYKTKWTDFYTFTNPLIYPVIILAYAESLKIVSDARNFVSLIDESKCIWPLEPIQVILPKIKGHYYNTADMISAHKQMPLDELLRRLTQFVIGKQQYEFKRLFYGISIGTAAFAAFMSKIFKS